MRKYILMILLAYVSLLARVHAADTAKSQPQKAVCAVCHPDGHGKPESVKASTVFNGKSFYFCSAACKSQFESDPDSYNMQALPRPFPDVKLIPLGGDSAGHIVGLRSKPLLVDVWATWCKPCEKILPRLQALHKKFGDKPIGLVGIAIDAEGYSKVAPFVQRKKIDYPIYLDISTMSPVWQSLGIRSIPALLMVDAKGNIVKQWGSNPNFEEIERELLSLIDAE